MAKTHFTVEEANALLATIRPVLERMVEHRRSLARPSIAAGRSAN